MSELALLVDTNVWFDYEMRTPTPEGRACAQFVSQSMRQGVRLGIAAHSLKDLFCLVERDIKRASAGNPAVDASRADAAARAVAWAVVNHILERVEVVGSDYMDALMSTKYRALHDFYEDNLVVAAAERMGANALVTNDKSLLSHVPVAVMTPAAALGWLKVAAKVFVDTGSLFFVNQIE